MTAPEPTSDRDRLEGLYHCVSPAILAYLLRRVPAREDAADLLAEVFLTAWRRRDTLPPPPEDRLWLFGVARRQLLAYHRAETRRHDAANELRIQLARTPSAGTATDTADIRRVVSRALERLPELDRELLTLTVWDGLTPSEAARVVGLSAGAARVRLHRARRRLASLLAEHSLPSPDATSTRTAARCAHTTVDHAR